MKNIFKSVIIILFATILINAQGTNYLTNLQNKFSKINDLSADFSEHTYGKVDFEGKFLYKKENHLKFNLKNLVVVSDGETNWNYNKKQNKVIITKFDKENPSAVSLERIINEFPTKCNITESKDNGVPLIELKPKANSGIKAQFIKIWLNNENLVKKISIKAGTGTVLEFGFTNYKINPGLPESEFTFTPPEGSKVLDIR
ncbi:MAG: outer membrane lipoprotein carrier protein LolA [Ignavibacteriaceae bacterium]